LTPSATFDVVTDGEYLVAVAGVARCPVDKRDDEEHEDESTARPGPDTAFATMICGSTASTTATHRDPARFPSPLCRARDLLIGHIHHLETWR
jgi:hypothetical protein